MVGVILTLVAIGLVSYFVIKNYYPPIILLEPLHKRWVICYN